MHRSEGSTHIHAHRRFRLSIAAAVLALSILGSPAGSNGAESYPRIANLYFGSLEDADLELFAGWDVLILAKRAHDRYQEEMDAIRVMNPDIEFLVHFPIGYCGDWTAPELNALIYEAVDGNDWWMRTASGGRAMMPFGSSLLNVTESCPTNDQGQRLNDWLPEFIAEHLGPGGRWDGAYLDYCMDDIAWANRFFPYGIDCDGNGVRDDDAALDEAWRTGSELLVSRLRELVGEDYIIGTSGNNTFYESVNGGTREDFPNMQGGWLENVLTHEHSYVALQARCRKPEFSLLNFIYRGPVGPDGPIRDEEFERRFAFLFASTLVFGNGYFSMDGGEGLEHHSQAWWHDLYDLDLGQPIDRASSVDAYPGDAEWVELGHLIKRRRFTNGVVVVNPSTSAQSIQLGGFYFEPSSWNGEFYPLTGVRQVVDVPSEGGAILVGAGRVLEAAWRGVSAEFDDDGVSVAWDRVPGARRYAVYRWHRRAETTSAKVLLDVVGGTFYLDGAASGRGTFYYQIAPIDTGGCEGRRSLPVEISIEGSGGRTEELWTEPNEPDAGRGVDALACSPHPVRDTTMISFEVDDDRWGDSSHVALTVYDVSGRVVRRLLDSPLTPGRHEIEWNRRTDGGARVASGCYFYALSVGEESLTGKMIVLD